MPGRPGISALDRSRKNAPRCNGIQAAFPSINSFHTPKGLQMVSRSWRAFSFSMFSILNAIAIHKGRDPHVGGAVNPDRLVAGILQGMTETQILPFRGRFEVHRNMHVLHAQLSDKALLVFQGILAIMGGQIDHQGETRPGNQGKLFFGGLAGGDQGGNQGKKD